MPDTVTDNLRKIHRKGVSQYKTFIEERLLKSVTPISGTITRNSFALFSRQNNKSKSKDKEKIEELKNDCSLFSRLYIASQTREGNLEEFFKHENQKYPPSLSKGGKLRQSKKADLLGCLESNIKIEDKATPPAAEVKVLDGAALVHFLPLHDCRTFGDYANEVFLPYVTSQLENSSRVDLVWDIYRKDSLKLTARENRGTGARRRVLPKVKLPSNWQNFLRNDENKDELFQFLAHASISEDVGDKVILSTIHESVISSNPGLNLDNLQPCSHEEADTRILLHVKDAMNSGYKDIMIRTVDTDVVVIAIAHFRDVEKIENMWIAFGTGKEFRYIPVHEVARSIGPDMAKALPFFHAVTGCDTTSYFANHGKKSALATWLAWPEITETFTALSSQVSPTLPRDVMKQLERYVVLLYCRTSDEETVNQTRMTLFCTMSRNIDNIPPTQAALEEHTRRAVFQAGHIWGQCLEKHPNVPPPLDWGWEAQDNQFKPKWTVLPIAEKACLELIACKCTKSCKGNCKCYKANSKLTPICTALCKCGGTCYKI